MLTTLIYRSHIRDDEPVKKIEEMVSIANRRNMQSDVTGILLFNGSHFFQLLEGPEEQVKMIYRAICQDPRHYNIVELLCDYAPARRFGKAGMELFDLRLHERDDVLQAVFDKGTSKFQLTYDDRALQFFRTFVLATEQSTYFEIPAEDSWLFIADGSDKELDSCALSPTINDHFAFHPIVDPLSRRIIAFEAIVQKNEDSPSAIAVGQRKDGEIYTADLKSKALAFTMAHALELGDKTVSYTHLDVYKRQVYRNTISSVFLITSALRISLVVSRECIRLKIIFLLLTLSPESIKLVTACPNTADSSSNKLPELRK
ncbi:blue light- and temperature-regulated antirepressor YcgF [Escherichia coli]|nr:blue light- and temperature-regulated antirepressor YcgF [Escherichia coli]